MTVHRSMGLTVSMSMRGPTSVLVKGDWVRTQPLDHIQEAQGWLSQIILNGLYLDLRQIGRLDSWGVGQFRELAARSTLGLEVVVAVDRDRDVLLIREAFTNLGYRLEFDHE